MKIEYHVFTDNSDHWTENIYEALITAEEMFKRNGNVRIYMEVYKNGTNKDPDENCIFSLGEFPR